MKKTNRKKGSRKCYLLQSLPALIFNQLISTFWLSAGSNLHNSISLVIIPYLYLKVINFLCFLGINVVTSPSLQQANEGEDSMGRRVHPQKRSVSWVNSVLRQFLANGSTSLLMHMAAADQRVLELLLSICISSFGSSRNPSSPVINSNPLEIRFLQPMYVRLNSENDSRLHVQPSLYQRSKGASFIGD